MIFKNHEWLKMSCLQVMIILSIFLGRGTKVDFKRKIQREFLG